MKLGELKIESLMMIFPGTELMVDYENDDELRDKISQLKDDSSYSDYLASMPGAINRCYSSLENKGIVPTKSVDLSKSTAQKRGTRIMFDLSAISDLGSIDRIAFYGNNGQDEEHCDYSHEGTSKVLLEERNGTYAVVYTPIIPRIKQITDDAKEIELPEDVVSLVPYFIKSELLRAENESEAAHARNVFEQMANELRSKNQGYQGAVISVYGGML